MCIENTDSVRSEVRERGRQTVTKRKKSRRKQIMKEREREISIMRDKKTENLLKEFLSCN